MPDALQSLITSLVRVAWLQVITIHLKSLWA